MNHLGLHPASTILALVGMDESNESMMRQYPDPTGPGFVQKQSNSIQYIHAYLHVYTQEAWNRCKCSIKQGRS